MTSKLASRSSQMRRLWSFVSFKEARFLPPETLSVSTRVNGSRVIRILDFGFILRKFNDGYVAFDDAKHK